MIRLSVNINKIATLRNARGGNVPDVQYAATAIQQFGAEGITVHPRPDERHITYRDVRLLRPLVYTEFNVEGYPDETFLRLVEEVRPEQVTLVPDAPNVLTSNAGWDCVKHKSMLTDIVARLHESGMRVSLFTDPVPAMQEAAALTGTDRVELYTEAYASDYKPNRKKAIAPYIEAARAAGGAGLGLNAGHDLSLKNLAYFAQNMPGLLEVSIGHALISDSIYRGLRSTVKAYKLRLITQA
jgi:pyridoxine 5-phosphate synthase